MDKVNHFIFPFFQQELPDDVQQPVWMKNLVAIIINAVRILHVAFQSKWEKEAHFEEGNDCIMWKLLSSILPTSVAVRSEDGAALTGSSRKACTGLELFATLEKGRQKHNVAHYNIIDNDDDDDHDDHDDHDDVKHMHAMQESTKNDGIQAAIVDDLREGLTVFEKMKKPRIVTVKELESVKEKRKNH